MKLIKFSIGTIVIRKTINKILMIPNMNLTTTAQMRKTLLIEERGVIKVVKLDLASMIVIANVTIIDAILITIVIIL